MVGLDIGIGNDGANHLQNALVNAFRITAVLLVLEDAEPSAKAKLTAPREVICVRDM
jgi:hypothetical protein